MCRHELHGTHSSASVLYLSTLRADSVRVQDKICQLFSPIAHIQAPIFAPGILILEVLQLLYNPNIAHKLLDHLANTGNTQASACFNSDCTGQYAG